MCNLHQAQMQSRAHQPKADQANATGRDRVRRPANAIGALSVKAVHVQITPQRFGQAAAAARALNLRTLGKASCLRCIHEIVVNPSKHHCHGCHSTATAVAELH